MKRIIFIAAIFAATGCFAQKEFGPLPYNKQKLDSFFRSYPKFNQPFVLPVPKGYTFPENAISDKPSSFEDTNPGAAVINQTSRGPIYNMPLDNMPVLVPDMNTVENMPGSNSNYKPAPRSNMPNPLRKDKNKY